MRCEGDDELDCKQARADEVDDCGRRRREGERGGAEKMVGAVKEEQEE